jgi:TPR repeat protein
MYENGQGVTRDYLRAHMWFNLAASESSGELARNANISLVTIAKSLTPAQVIQAQEMARQCEARSFKNCD